MRTTLIDKPEYLVEYSRAATGEILLHVQVHKWNHTVYKELIAETVALHQHLGSNMYASYMDEKQEKFMRMLGFAPTELVAFTKEGDPHLLYRFEV